MDSSSPPPYEESLAAEASGCSTAHINEGYEKDHAESSDCAPAHTNEDYEKDHDYIAPPTAPPVTYVEAPQMILPEFHELSNEEIRNACYEYVDETWCYGKRAIRDMVFQSITSTCSLHYKLESFTEKRQSADRCEPYHRQLIDGPENGPPPTPWDIAVNAPVKFQDNRRCVEIPHTARVETCWRCNGRGKVQCSSCSGRGRVSCSCRSGRDSKGNTCTWCHGRGRRRCIRCSGTGKVTCKTCSGHGKLKYFKELIVTWKNNVDDFVANPMNLPIDRITKAAGRNAFIEENPVVFPLAHSPDESLNQESVRLINKHRAEFSSLLILVQRQTLRAIPVTRIDYAWRRKSGEFYVYGYDNNVYFENYPQKCCCCTCC